MDTVSLDRKVAIIAGASRGMGREIAIAYALAGVRGVTVTAAPARGDRIGAIKSLPAGPIVL